MFTGLIQTVGYFAGLTRMDGGAIMRISHGPWDAPLEKGESVAVQGVCVTVTACEGTGAFSCDVLDETLQRSNLRSKIAGCRLNIERALRAGDRMGGHIVSGHADGTGTIVSIRPAGRDHIVRIGCNRDMLQGIVEKGSVACDGVSLTVSAMGPSWFEVNMIPTTWEQTSLCDLKSGDAVNIETDMLGKFVRSYLDSARGVTNAGGLTMEDLKGAGFI